MWSIDLVSLSAGFLAGAVVAWLILRIRYPAAATGKDAGALAGELAQWKSEKDRAEERSRIVEENLRQANAGLDSERTKVVDLSAALSRAEADSTNVSERLREQKEELASLQQTMQEQFQRIAQEILLDSSRQLKLQHQQELADILNPFKEKIDKFEKRVDDTHKENIRDNQSLKEQILVLQRLNQSIGEEAKNLTSALKGQSKVQGNWGEIILERILEKSGLVRDREYVVQSSMTNEDGRRLQPDVIVSLPEGKHLVIDSKVSLAAYDRFSASEDDVVRAQALREHLESIRRHIRDLGQKNYQNLYQIKSPDFVFMFIPIEPAFNLAIQHDSELYNDAFEKNIVLISTSTLWASLRIIANLWRQEYQSRNAIEIARQGGDLYDKFVGFIEDMVELGRKLQSADRNYQDAMNKLHKGKGNLVRRAEEMKSLGVKTAKSLPRPMLERGNDEDLPAVSTDGNDS